MEPQLFSSAQTPKLDCQGPVRGSIIPHPLTFPSSPYVNPLPPINNVPRNPNSNSHDLNTQQFLNTHYYPYVKTH